jgi:2-keto-4-pentenoate hydratase/2-oxohepta-3-ene-1,7-dioic acid hydratase in catechol pathway
MQVSEEEAMDSVFGYTVANDLSARDWQMKRYILARMIHPCLPHSFLPV